MAYPMGEAKQEPLRVDFDRRLKLEFHGSDISWWDFFGNRCSVGSPDTRT